MIDALYAHDSPAGLREYDAHIARQEMAEAQYQERRLTAVHDCLDALNTNAVSTFNRYGFLQCAQAGELFQELFNLYVDRKVYGLKSASFEAFYRAFDAWVAAEIERHALDAAGVSV